MEKKPVVRLNDWLYGDGVFTLNTTVNYNDKVIMYERGIVKTEVIDGKEFTGREPKVPYLVIELDKKIRAYKQEAETLRASRNDLSKQIGQLMREKKMQL